MEKKKYVFSDDHSKSCENLGISESRHDEMFEIAKDVCMRAMFFDKNINTRTKAIELFLNEAQPESIVEAFWFGCVFMDVWTQTEKIGKRISEMIET